MKILEIRDRATYIAVAAFKTIGNTELENYHYRQLGFNQDHVIVVKLNDCKANYSSFKWDRSSRTMRVAHDYISAHWENLSSGDVIDVEFILGESKQKKEPQQRTDYLQDLARSRDIPIEVVMSLAETLGPNEDRDGLLSILDDYQE